MLVPLLLSLACAATDIESRATVSSSVRAGQIASLSARSEAGAEAVVEPALLLDVNGRTRATELRVFGRFSTLQLETQDQSFARGGLSLSQRLSIDRARELFAIASASGGTLDFRQATVFLGGPAETETELPAEGATATQIDSFLVRFYSADAELGMRTELSPQRTFTLSGKVIASEGEGDDEAAGLNQFPRQRTVSVNGVYEHGVSRRDTLRLTVDASLSEFEAVGTYRVANLNGGWLRRFRDGSVGLDLGALVVQSNATEGLSVVPSASMNAERDVWTRGEQRVRTRFETGILTAFDRFSGRLLPRAQASLSLRATFGPEWQLSASGVFQNPIGDGIGGVIPGLVLNSTARANARAAWRVARELSLTAGIEWAIRATPLDEPWQVLQRELVGSVGLSVDYTL